MKNNYLHNSNFVNFSCDCCSQNTWADNTRFGQWVDSGFKSKKKRDAEAAANIASAGSQINSLYGNAPSSSAPIDTNTSTSNDTSSDTNYGGSGISDTVVNKVAPNISFGTAPSIDSVTSSNSVATCGVKKPTSKYSTNYLYWGIAAAVVVGGVFAVRHLYKNGVIKLPAKK